MRLVTIALSLAVSVTGVSTAQKPAVIPPKPAIPTRRADANPQTPGVPGLPGPRLKLIEGPFIDGKKEEFESDVSVNLGPGGQIVVRAGYSVVKAFDSTGRRLWTLKSGRGGEVGAVAAMGWRGSEVWVMDGRYQQIALIDHGTVTKSLELPTFVRPSWSNRKTFPVFGYLDVRAMLPDGSMIGMPYRPHSVVGTPGFDSTMQHVVRVTESGIIERQIARFPSLDYARRVAYGDARQARSGEYIPNAWRLTGDYWPRVRVSSDGMRTVVVSVDTSQAGVDTIVVAAVNEKGEPAYTRKFGFPRKSFTEREIDSIARLRFPSGDTAYRARRARTLPRTLPAVRDVTLGRDYSVWVTLRDTDGPKPIVGIGAAGQFVGTTYIPQTVWLKAADGNRLWLVDYRPTRRDVVRYAIAKP